MFAWLRFATIIGIAGCWYYLLPFGIWQVVVSCFLLLILFIRLVFFDIKNKADIEHTSFLISINEDEIKALAHSYFHFTDGREFIPKEHLYANDLDIFGHASLYQYINRTSSYMGSRTLADWLLQPSAPQILKERQVAIKEMAGQTAWRQQLQAFGAAVKIKETTSERLQAWFAEGYRFINSTPWLIVRFVIPAATLTAIALNITGVMGNPARNYCLLVSALVCILYQQKSNAPASAGFKNYR